MRAPNVITAGFSDDEKLRIRLVVSIKSPGLNPEYTFLLLAKVLEDQFGDRADPDAAKRFVALVRGKQPHGMEMEPQQLLKLVTDLKHPQENSDKALKARMNAMRNRVRELLDAADPLLRAEQVDNTPAMGKQGRPPTSESKPYKNENVSFKYGNTASYRLAVLKRDHPEIAERYAAGEFKSVSAAERAVGIRESRDRDPVDRAITYIKRMKPADIKRLVKWLADEGYVA